MSLKSKRILVTGGAGFIGSHIVDALLSRGCDVTVLDNLSTGSLANLEHVKGSIDFHEGDIQDQQILEKTTKDRDIIFHHAAMVSAPRSVENPIDSAMVNDMGTLFVLEAARKNNVKRIVLASSCAVYGDDPELPKHEGMNSKPLSPYAVQKLIGEHYARLYHDLFGIKTVCLRYFNVYGPRQDPSSPYSGVISLFITRAVAKESPVIYGDGNQYRDFIFIKDVVNANLLAASTDAASGKVINVGTGGFVRINQLWEKICFVSGLEIESRFEPARPGDILESVAGMDYAKSILGFEPEYSFDQGLEITFKWYENEK